MSSSGHIRNSTGAPSQPRYFRSLDSSVGIIHVEREDGWENYSVQFGHLLSSSKRAFPAESLAEFEEIDEHEATRLLERGRISFEEVRALEDPTGKECQVCGRSPVAFFTFAANKGLILTRQVSYFEGSLCRSCAAGVFRHYQTRNLSWGWFGVVSFFATIGHAFQNMGSYYSGRSGLTEPSPTDPLLEKRLRGRPVFLGVLQRLGVIVAVLGLAVVVVWATTCRGDDRLSTSSTESQSYLLSLSSEATYLDRLPALNVERSSVVELSEQRLAAWSAGPRTQPPGEDDLVAAELEALLRKADLLSTMLFPGVGTLPEELAELHATWVEALQEVVSAERALSTDFSDASTLAADLAWAKEDETFADLVDYYNSHLGRLEFGKD
jgi:hypothetical protein